MKAPYTLFNVTRNVPVTVFLNGEEIESDTWDEEFYICRSEEWYCLMSSQFKDKKVRVILERVFQCSEKIYPQEIPQEVLSKKIYICGKVTGLPIHDVTMKFGNAEKIIVSNGLTAVNPLSVVNDFKCPWPEAMKKCIAAMVQCDAILLLDDWMDSKGALIEQRIASDIGIRCLIGTKDLANRIKLFSNYHGKE
jgi:hypothetical protein